MNPDIPTPARPPRSYDVFTVCGSVGLFRGEYIANNAAHAAEMFAENAELETGVKILVYGVMDHGEPHVGLFTVDRKVSLIRGH